MINPLKLCALTALVLALVAANFASADPIPSYQTNSFATIVNLDNSSTTENYSFIAGNSDFSTSGFLQSPTQGGTGLSYSGYAAAERGTLHSQSQFSEVGSHSLTNGGIIMSAMWHEPGVHVTTVGPNDLLAGLSAYEVTWNLDGSIQGVGPYISAVLSAFIIQDGITTVSSSVYYTSPLGPVTFYLQPSNPDEPFDFDFELGTSAQLTYSVGITAANVDFGNTATLESLQGVDANHNIMPGVELELSDGTIIGPSGLMPTPPAPSTVPEPASWVLAGGGASLLWVLVSARRKLQTMHA